MSENSSVTVPVGNDMTQVNNTLSPGTGNPMRPADDQAVRPARSAFGPRCAIARAQASSMDISRPAAVWSFNWLPKASPAAGPVALRGPAVSGK